MPPNQKAARGGGRGMASGSVLRRKRRENDGGSTPHTPHNKTSTPPLALHLMQGTPTGQAPPLATRLPRPPPSPVVSAIVERRNSSPTLTHDATPHALQRRASGVGESSSSPFPRSRSRGPDPLLARFEARVERKVKELSDVFQEHIAKSMPKHNPPTAETAQAKIIRGSRQSSSSATRGYIPSNLPRFPVNRTSPLSVPVTTPPVSSLEGDDEVGTEITFKRGMTDRTTLAREVSAFTELYIQAALRDSSIRSLTPDHRAKYEAALRDAVVESKMEKRLSVSCWLEELSATGIAKCLVEEAQNAILPQVLLLAHK